MDFEGRQWSALSAEEKDEAFAFVPPVFDRDLGPNFRSCVVQKAQLLQQKFDLGKTLGERGGGKRVGGPDLWPMIYYMKM